MSMRCTLDSELMAKPCACGQGKSHVAHRTDLAAGMAVGQCWVRRAVGMSGVGSVKVGWHLPERFVCQGVGSRGVEGAACA